MEDKKIRLLFVEDDPTWTFVIKSGLEQVIKGYEVTVAANGREGLRAYENIRPDIIVTDGDMPEMNGFEMVERIRETDRETPILFASALTSPDDVTNGYKRGVNNYVKKPFVPQELDAHIRALIKMIRNDKSRDGITCYRFGRFTLDVPHSTLRNRVTGENKPLSLRETRILELLAANKGEVVRREVFISRLWDTDDEHDFFLSRNLDVYIAKLRKYLDEDETIQIQTLRKVGLMMTETNAEGQSPDASR